MNEGLSDLLEMTLQAVCELSDMDAGSQAQVREYPLTAEPSLQLSYTNLPSRRSIFENLRIM